MRKRQRTKWTREVVRVRAFIKRMLELKQRERAERMDADQEQTEKPK